MNYREQARGRNCMVRLPGVCNFDAATTVLAHYRLMGVSGMGMKSPDICGAWACSDCHAYVDTHKDDATARAFLPNLPREYVLRRRNGKPYSENGFRAIWQHGMRRAVKGIKKRDGTWRKAPVLKTRFTFHDLRAKSVSDSDTIEHAFERAGHTSMAMTRGVYDRGVRKVKPLR